MARKILIVDDDPKWLRIASLYFEEQRYQVAAVLSGDEALREIARDRPDLIIADIIMPGMDGYELCSRLRRDETTRAIPFIFLTGRDEDTDKARARKVGADDYLTKPCPLQRLAQSVETAMDRIEQARKIPLGEIGLSGRLDDVNLLDMIQTLELEQRTGALVLSHGERSGTIYFREGGIVHADILSPKRDEPLFVLLGWKTGRFLFLPGAAPDRMPITASMANLLIQDLRTLEAHERRVQDAPFAEDSEFGPTHVGRVLSALQHAGRLLHSTTGSSRPAVIRILVVGVAHSGKSEFIDGVVKDLSESRWAATGTEEPFARHRTDFGRVRVSRDTVLHLIAVRAEKRFFSVWEQYLPAAFGVILLADLGNEEGMNHLQAFLKARATLTPALPIHAVVPGDRTIEGKVVLTVTSSVAEFLGLQAADVSSGRIGDQAFRLTVLDRVLQLRIGFPMTAGPVQ